MSFKAKQLKYKLVHRRKYFSPSDVTRKDRTFDFVQSWNLKVVYGENEPELCEKIRETSKYPYFFKLVLIESSRFAKTRKGWRSLSLRPRSSRIRCSPIVHALDLGYSAPELI